MKNHAQFSACKHNVLEHSAPPARLLVDDTHTHILTDCEEGNLVSVPGVGGNTPHGGS